MSVPSQLKDIPFFPPICVTETHAPEVCTVFGFEINCVKNFTDEDFRLTGLYGSHLWTFFFSFCAGCVQLSYIKPFLGWQWKDSMRVTIGLYAIVTSLFSLCRVTIGIGKPLILICALHNLCEWSILLHCVDKKFGKFLGENLTLASIFIFTIITVCLMIPNTMISLAFEQLFGSMLEIALPIMFGKKLFFDHDKEVSQFYLLPFLAHSIHLLFSILPTIFTIFWRLHPSIFCNFVLEIFINLSIPTTLLLYMLWSSQVDEIMSTKNPHPSNTSSAEIKNESIKHQDKTIIPPKASPPEIKDESINHQDQTAISPKSSSAEIKDDRKIMPAGFQIQGVWGILIKSLFLALIPLMLAPILMGFCNEDTLCTQSEVVHQTTTYIIAPGLEGSLEDAFASKEIANIAKSYQGSVDFKISKSVDNFNRKVVQILDVWSSIDFAEKWKNSEHAKFLKSKEVLDILADGKISSTGYLSEVVLSPSCRKMEEKVHIYDYHHSCNFLWKELSTTRRCDLIPRCIQVAQDQFGSDIFSFSDGRILKGKRFIEKSSNMNISYHFDDIDDKMLGGFKSDILLESKSKNICTVYVKMSIPSNGDGNTNALGAIVDNIKFIDHQPI